MVQGMDKALISIPFICINKVNGPGIRFPKLIDMRFQLFNIKR